MMESTFISQVISPSASACALELFQDPGQVPSRCQRWNGL